MTGNKQEPRTLRSLLNEEPKKVVVAKPEPKGYTPPQTIAIRSLVDAKMKVTGAVTRKEYIFVSAGAVQNVDRQDANDILNKKRGKTCCGTASDHSLFELVI